MSVANDVVASSGRKQSEQQVALQVQKVLAVHFPGYTVETGKNLLYKIEVDPSGQLTHESAANPMRGKYAFQTDILITKDTVPLVVIELKSGSFNSHDVITYSFKAARHKQIYPYLRYGFVVVGSDGLGRRFVTHNEGFDFAMALPESTKIETALVAMVRRQISGAEQLCDLMRSDRIKILRYEETVEIDR